jgi:CRISPR-associated protein Csd1
MAWIEKLHATYEACKGREPPGAESLMPISHAVQQAHIEITIDGAGNFKDARAIPKEETVIPASEKSAGRTSGAAAHPLCDKVQYCAADYPIFGGTKTSYFTGYEAQLAAWCESRFSHPKARAVLAYIGKGNVVADLVRHKVLHIGPDGRLLMQWTGDGEAPEIFRQLTAKDGLRDQGDAFIRWIVWIDGDLCPEVWKDAALQEAWIGYDSANNVQTGLCMATGEANAVLASSHPKRIRHGGDGAKLISANDGSGYTFRGRFTDADGKQAAGVGYVSTQKAHSALRWLIKRQAYRNGDQTFVAWAVVGKPIPDPWADSDSMILGIESATGEDSKEPEILVGDVGQAFARRLNRAIAGYGAKLDPTDDIIIMGLDSATPGRMAIIYYRELIKSEYLNRIKAWHAAYAWPQNFGKDRHFTGAPAPHDIAEAAFGRRLDEKLKKATVERLLPCIVDGRPVPRDLVVSAVQRASNRVGLEYWEWEKVLGIACGLFRGWSKSEKKEYAMALEENRTSRDYLYGRLLAVADNLERFALTAAEKNRDTMAGRLMQRFAERPFSTWRTIELALTPYKTRLRASDKSTGFLWSREKLIDEIQCRFVDSDSFTNDNPLSGEFLLGYHCQRAALFAGTNTQTTDQPTSEDNAS